MATAYVSANRGDDTTGDGSAATPWKTITHAIGGASPAFVVDGSNPNTLYIEPGLYREAIVLATASSSSAPLSIVGDTDGAGFLAGGYATPAVGVVEIRAWSDDATPIAANTLFVNITYDHVTVERIKFVGGAKTDGAIDLNGALYFTLRDCTVVGYYDGTTSNGNCVRALANAGVPIGLTAERCVFVTMVAGSAAVVVYVAINPTDWSLDSKITNCEFHGPSTGLYVTLNGAGTGAFYPSGMAIQNCTFAGMQYGVYVHYSTTPLTTPYTVNGCGFAGAAIYADTTGQVIEDGNVFSNLTGTNPASVAAGANSVFGVCPSFNFGADRVSGLPLRPFLAPADVSTLNAFGSYGTVPTDDMAGRGRPEGHASVSASAGCYERHDTGVQNFVYQDAGAAACMALVGPSSHERLILVDPTSTTITVKVRWDGNHGDANKPQAVLIAEPQIGVAGQTVTATSTGGTGTTPNAYETLTFASFTPTGKGAVMLRLVSRAAAGGGIAYFSL